MAHVLKIKNEKGDWENVPAIQGESAYEIACRYGYEGTEAEWYASLPGKSAYDYAVELGFEGTEEEYKEACEAQRILSIKQTTTSTESGGTNVWTATFGNGAKRQLIVRNGEKGEKGEDAGVKPPDDTSTAHTKTVPVHASDVAEIKMLGGMTYKDGDTLRSAPVSAVESVGVNLITPSAVSRTVDGVTFVVNADGSIDVHGTATANHYYRVGSIDIDAGTYTLSGSIKGGSSNTFALYLQGVGVSSGGDTGNNKVVTISAALSCDVLFLIRTGSTVDGTLRPMLNKGSAALPYSSHFKHTLEIPESAQALDGYGEGVNDDVYNYIDLEGGKYHKRVGKVDMGTLDWIKSTGYAYSKGISASIEGACLAAVPSEVSRYYINDAGNIMILFPNDVYADASAVKAAMSGVMLYYELAEHIITDISDIMGDNHIEVVEGGTLTFVNEHGYDVPSVVDYSASADVRIVPQSFNSAQKKQARQNIGIHFEEQVPSDISKYAVGDFIFILESSEE